MSTRVCGRCRRPLPAPSEGGTPAPCPFCAAQDAGRAGGGRAAQSRPPADAGAPKKRAEAFASALAENAGRTTPVHSFAVPPEAIPLVQARKREAAPAPTPPPVVLAPPPAPVVTILPPAAAPAPQPPPAPPPRRAAAVTATLASLGPGPLTPQSRPGPAAPAIVASQAASAVVAAPAAVAVAAAPAAALAAVYAPAVAPAPAAAPHLVPVPTPSPAPIATAPAPAAAPAPKAVSAASLASTMLAFSPELPESRRAPEPREATPPPMSEAPRAGARHARRRRLEHQLVSRRQPGAAGTERGARTAGGVRAARGRGSRAAALVRLAGRCADPRRAFSVSASPAHARDRPGGGGRAGGPGDQRGRVPAPRRLASVHRNCRVGYAASESSGAAACRAAHHRTVARASDRERSSTSAAPTDDSDKMARAREAYREGNERLFHGDAAGAITSYEEMMRLNPKDPGGYRGMGLASAQLGKRTEAVRYLRAYLKHAPNADDRGIIISRISLLQTLPQQ
jgi:hypothetical protein